MFTGWPHKGAQEPRTMYNRLKEKIGYMCGQPEKTKEGKKHYQIYVQFKQPQRATAIIKMFQPGQWNNKPADDNQKECIKYVSKEDTRIGDFQEFGLKKEERKSTELKIIKEKIQAGVSMKTLCEDHWDTMVRYYKGIVWAKTKLESCDSRPKFKLEQFPTWKPITDWSKTHILYGASQIGKTEFALAHFKNPLLVSHIDQLKNLEKRHDGIVFDDMDFMGSNDTPPKGKWSLSSQIHMVDQNHLRAINVKHTVAIIPAHTKKIFTTNKTHGYIFDLNIDAISNRTTATFLRKFRGSNC